MLASPVPQAQPSGSEAAGDGGGRGHAGQRRGERLVRQPPGGATRTTAAHLPKLPNWVVAPLAHAFRFQLYAYDCK